MNPLDAVKFDEITLEDVNKLQEYAYPEGKDIDYKRKLSLFPEEGEKNTDADKRRLEFLRDVSSFANTHGGYLIFGIEEEEKIPSAMPGFAVDDTEKLDQRIEQLLQNGVNPKIQGIRLRWLNVDENNKILIVKIPNSWNPPHMVTFNSHNRFDARNSMGKYFMDVEDLRMAFTQAASINDSFLSFRKQRIEAIKNNEGICVLPDGAKIIIHLLPYSFLREPNLLDIANMDPNFENFELLNRSSFSRREINFDGWLTFQEPCTGYNQWFRHGGFEIVDAWILNRKIERQEKVIPDQFLEKRLIESLQKNLALMDRYEIPEPYCFMISLINIEGYYLVLDKYFPEFDPSHSIKKQNLFFSPMMIQKENSDIAKKLKPIFDWLWNASGYKKCPNYNDLGEWSPRIQS